VTEASKLIFGKQEIDVTLVRREADEFAPAEGGTSSTQLCPPFMCFPSCVTISEFSEYLNSDIGQRMLSNYPASLRFWQFRLEESGTPDEPVTGLTCYEAMSCAAYFGGRLGHTLEYARYAQALVMKEKDLVQQIGDGRIMEWTATASALSRSLPLGFAFEHEVVSCQAAPVLNVYDLSAFGQFEEGELRSLSVGMRIFKSMPSMSWEPSISRL
jgi:hypothetical protein